MTEGEALRFIEEHGIVLEAARGPAHRVTRTSFRKWVASDVLEEAATLSVVDAFAQLGPLALRR